MSENDDQEWEERLEREERRRKQRMVLFGTTAEEQAEAEAASGQSDTVSVTINGVPREYREQLQDVAHKYALSLSQLGNTGLALALISEHEGKLADLIQGLDLTNPAELDDGEAKPKGWVPAEVVTIAAQVSRDMHQQLQQAAFRDGHSMRRLVQIALELALHHSNEGTLPKLPTWPERPDEG